MIRRMTSLSPMARSREHRGLPDARKNLNTENTEKNGEHGVTNPTLGFVSLEHILVQLHTNKVRAH
jgi:hypothetical protein